MPDPGQTRVYVALTLISGLLLGVALTTQAPIQPRAASRLTPPSPGAAPAAD